MFRGRVSPLLVTAALLAPSACASHLETGRRYVKGGNLPVAVEVMSAGLRKNPGDEQLRNALILAQQSHHHQLRRQIDRLQSKGRPLAALGRLLLLDESSRHAAELQLPGGDPDGLERERRKLIEDAAERLTAELDQRTGRGRAMRADLERCRQLAVLQNDPAVERSCERLLARFKYYARLDAGPGAPPQSERAMAALASVVAERNPELIEIVEAGDERLNAAVTVHIGEPEFLEIPWTLVEHDAYHTWIRKKNRKGQYVEETVTVHPTEKEIEEAKRKGKPRPKPKKVKKKVYEEVQGEYRHYRAERAVSIAYALRVKDLRRDGLPVVLRGITTSRAESRYHVYEGHPRARKSAPGTPEGSRKAAPLPGRRKLLQRTHQELPQQIAEALLGRIE